MDDASWDLVYIEDSQVVGYAAVLFGAPVAAHELTSGAKELFFLRGVRAASHASHAPPTPQMTH